jgi:uncharacterized protein (TIGR03000 family)
MYYSQAMAAPAATATVRMSVPSDARVWIEDQPTTPTGAERTFVSPDLIRGQAYVYHVRVQWTENNKPMELSREVLVHAGDEVNFSVFQ